MLYFFDLSDGGFRQDENGVELPSEQEAQCRAVVFAGEVLRREPDRLAHGRLRVDVGNGLGRILFTVEVKLHRA